MARTYMSGLQHDTRRTMPGRRSFNTHTNTLLRRTPVPSAAFLTPRTLLAPLDSTRRTSRNRLLDCSTAHQTSANKLALIPLSHTLSPRIRERTRTRVLRESGSRPLEPSTTVQPHAFRSPTRPWLSAVCPVATPAVWPTAHINSYRLLPAFKLFRWQIVHPCTI